MPYIGFLEEQNPFLGWRAIRMIDRHPEMLKGQFRAALRAGVGHTLRIMVPMISNLAELLAAKALYAEAQVELAQEGIPQAENVQFGIMIEVPAAALIADTLAQHVDFFSIGTNDLTQYTLAVDRTNERIAHLASTYHPAVLRLMKIAADAAHAQGKWIGICGAFGGDAQATQLLIGLGIDELSMAATMIPEVKSVVRKINTAEAKRLADEVLKLPDAESVIAYLAAG